MINKYLKWIWKLLFRIRHENHLLKFLLSKKKLECVQHLLSMWRLTLTFCFIFLLIVLNLFLVTGCKLQTFQIFTIDIKIYVCVCLLLFFIHNLVFFSQRFINCCLACILFKCFLVFFSYLKVFTIFGCYVLEWKK